MKAHLSTLHRWAFFFYQEIMIAYCGLDCEKFSPYPFSIFGEKYIPGSTDVGDVSYSCPAIMLDAKIGDSENPMEQHTPHVLECAASEPALENAMNFIKGFVMTGIDLISKPELLEEIKTEFAEIQQK